MKKNNIKPNKFIEFFHKLSKPENRNLVLIYLCSLVVFLLIFIWGPSPTAGDTDTNVAAGSVIMKGNLDALRTPVYPLFIYLFKSLFGYGVLTKLLIIISQYLVFCISILCFNSTVKYFIKLEKLSYFLVFLYACHPAMLVWQKIIMTESFALTGMVFLMYFIVQFLRDGKSAYSWLINITLLLLIMLRPVFLFLIPIILLFWIYLIFKKNKKAYLGVALNFTVVILTISYGFYFQKQFGVFNLSTVSDVNQYMMLREANLVSTREIEDLNMRKAIDDSIKIKKTGSDYFDEYISFYTKFGYKSCHIFIKNSMKDNLQKYIDYNVQRVEHQSLIAKVGYWEGLAKNLPYRIIHFIYIPFLILFVFLILYISVLYKNKKHQELSALIYVIFIANLFSIVVAAPNSWGRLIVPTIPILLIMAGQTIEILILKHKQKNSLII